MGGRPSAALLNVDKCFKCGIIVYNDGYQWRCWNGHSQRIYDAPPSIEYTVRLPINGSINKLKISSKSDRLRALKNYYKKRYGITDIKSTRRGICIYCKKTLIKTHGRQQQHPACRILGFKEYQKNYKLKRRKCYERT